MELSRQREEQAIESEDAEACFRHGTCPFELTWGWMRPPSRVASNSTSARPLTNLKWTAVAVTWGSVTTHPSFGTTAMTSRRPSKTRRVTNPAIPAWNVSCMGAGAVVGVGTGVVVAGTVGVAGVVVLVGAGVNVGSGAVEGRGDGDGACVCVAVGVAAAAGVATAGVEVGGIAGVTPSGVDGGVAEPLGPDVTGGPTLLPGEEPSGPAAVALDAPAGGIVRGGPADDVGVVVTVAVGPG